MKHVCKRIGAVLLALAMLATMMPAVFAATTLPTSVTGLTASWEYSNQGGGSATWTSSGTSISAETKGTAAKTNVSDLTLTNNSGAEAVLSFNWSLTTGGTTSATRSSLSGAIVVSNKASASGEFSQTLAAGESITIQLKSPRGASFKGVFEITDLALVGLSVPDPILTFKPVTEGGSYTVDGVAVTADVVKEVALQTALQLAATADEGYVFYGWYNAKTDKYLSQDANFKLVASEDAEIYPVFLTDDVALFGVGSAKYDNLSEAAAAAVDTVDKKVVLLNDGTITGDHVIPAGVTLLIPYNDANTAHGSVPACTSSDGNEVTWVQPYAYRTLTMAADASITVNGALEVGGRHSAAAAGRPAAPTDALGYIYMTAGSHIEVNGDLYAWGYIYGDGSVTANNGAAIYEVFQITDLRGGNATLALASDMLVFPMTQYYVQNVEVATTYYYGATAYITTSFFLASQCITAPPIKFIGEDAMFQTGEDCYIVKEYDAATDTLNLDAYGDCALSSIVVSLAGNTVDSTNFVLPISNNINIAIWSGTATLKQDIAMLPGSTLTVGPEAVLEIGSAEVPTAAMTAGYNLIVFDSENWTTALNENTFAYESGLNFVYPGKQFVSAPYSPSERKVRTIDDLKDVVFDINGVVVANGFIYSTVIWNDVLSEDFSIVSGGAEIISSAGTGVLCMNSGAGSDMLIYQYDQSKDDAYKKSPEYDVESGDTLYYMISLASAQLQNGNGSLLDTTGAEAGAYYTYCNEHDHWIAGDECTNVEITWVVNGQSVTSEVVSGFVPEYPAGTPSKAVDNNSHYVFAGWATTEGGDAIALPVATESATYYAVFTAETHAYGIAAIDGKHVCVCGKPASCVDAENDGDHVCDLGCGTVKSEHLGGTATCDKQAVCTECGIGYGDLKGHTAGAAADCENDQTCTVCGTVLATAIGHNYKGVVTAPTCVNGGYTTYTCLNCNHSYVGNHTDAKGHTAGAAADCENDQVCTVCGTVLATAIGHKWDDATCTAPKTCSVCGATEGEALEHTYDDEYDADCNVCGETREVPEKPSTEVIYGDANGDGKVTGVDAALLQQYVAGWTVTMDLVAADANGDGKVTGVDAALLQQYVAGWTVTLGPAL